MKYDFSKLKYSIEFQSVLGSLSPCRHVSRGFSRLPNSACATGETGDRFWHSSSVSIFRKFGSAGSYNRFRNHARVRTKPRRFRFRFRLRFANRRNPVVACRSGRRERALRTVRAVRQPRRRAEKRAVLYILVSLCVVCRLRRCVVDLPHVERDGVVREQHRQRTLTSAHTQYHYGV